ncbi:sugar transferase [Marinilactibacillus kalidii]|uniref:sugar transferase n=1 Tax=Marinilactibacillus kalidii TaxID=2820274 RepID=UPI001ABEC8B3|nr:sugar transferase [Marinilactibacillus kalidii]
MYPKMFKRFIDILLSSLALFFLFPLIILIMLMIKVSSKGPILFSQRRIGKDRKEFIIYKFRTMIVDTPKDSPTHLLADSSKYITKIGKVLRSTSLDELPQLYNVLKGDMSIIGPRPALWNQEDLIKERDLYNANAILPGLSGWAQINGRDEISITEKAKLDGEYVENVSFKTDLKCIFLTGISVVKSDGIYEGQKKHGEL